MAGEARPETPALAVTTAPAGAVQAESLAPPTGSGQSNRGQTAAAAPTVRASATPAGAAAVPQRLPEEIWQTPPRPGQLAIECGGFSRPEYANLQRERLARLGAYITTDYYAARDRAYIVRLGPFRDIASAEAAMRRALPLVPDARIVVE
jgi:cell division septation protein DedD